MEFKIIAEKEKNEREINMEILRKNVKAALLCVCIAVVILFSIAAVRPGYAGGINSTRSWLSQYEGENMRITFVSAPSFLETDLQKTSALTLVNAGDAGIVVTFGPKRTVFFPYSQIAGIEPIYRRN